MQEDLDLDIKGRTVTGTELHNYESQAIVIEERGLELARVGLKCLIYKKFLQTFFKEENLIFSFLFN